MVTLLIQSEMGLPDFDTAEDVKKYPLAKVESLFHIRHENGTVEFFQQPLDPNLFAKVVILKEGKLLPLEGDWSMEKIRLIRQQAKQKVFVTNAIRALTRVSPHRQCPGYSVRGAGGRLRAGLRGSADGDRRTFPVQGCRGPRKYPRHRRPPQRGGHRAGALPDGREGLICP